jgi:YidC/Oxa1 family membrane protein insertase
MDRNALIGLVLISGLMVGYFFLNKPEPKPSTTTTQNEVNDAIASSLIAESNPDSTESLLADSDMNENQDSLLITIPNAKLGEFSNAASGIEEKWSIENDKIRISISNLGGAIKSAELKQYKTFFNKYYEETEQPLNLIFEENQFFSLNFFHEARFIETGNLYFVPTNHQAKATQNNPATISFQLNAGENHFIRFNYSLPENSYLANLSIELQNMNEILDPGTAFLGLDWSTTAPHQELDLENERNRSTLYYRDLSGNVSRTGRGGPSSENIESPLQWISAKQQFFSTTLIVPDGLLKPTKAQTSNPTDLNTVSTIFQVESSLAFNNSPNQNIEMQWYLGPNHYQSLKKLNLGLEDQIDLGYIGIFTYVNKWLIIPVFNFFENYGINYGIIILLLTIIIKIILSPLNFKTFISSAKMRVLKPEIDALSAKFKPEDALKKQQAMMQLYRQAGVNPLAGCIPALLQMPILLAMFSFFPSAIELRQESFLWAKDLSAYDSIFDLPFSIPFYGDHISLFTLLMTITTIIYTQMSSGQMNSGPQAQQMKIMMFIMPIVFLGVLNSYSSALSYYYFLSNLTSILIMLVIRKFFIDESKLREKINAYLSDPSKAKKSKWAQRLDRIQKAHEEKLKAQKSGTNRSGRRKN